MPQCNEAVIANKSVFAKYLYFIYTVVWQFIMATYEFWSFWNLISFFSYEE